MNKKIMFFISIFLFINYSHLFAETKLVIETADIVADTNTFALDLYRNLKNSQGNVFFSPYSVSDVSCMVYMGASGNTEKQMTDVLHLLIGPEKLVIQKEHLYPMIERTKEMLGEIKNNNLALNIASSLWLEKDRKIISLFYEFMNKYYPNSLNRVNFEKDTEEARSKINSWVELNTNNRIKDFLGPDMLTIMTRLVLVNAIYFNAEWQLPFQPKLTRNDYFWISNEQSLNVPMMHQRQNCNYYENEYLQILELPYKDNKLSLFILLPISKMGLSEAEEILTISRLNRWLGSLDMRYVAIYLPKFRIDSKFDLVDTLSAQGMPDAFDKDRANFSGIDGTRMLYVSHFIHNAFIEVDEFRTEATAASAAIMDLKSMQPIETPIEFRADHPFIFLIRHNATGCILFLGKVVNPNS